MCRYMDVIEVFLAANSVVAVGGATDLGVIGTERAGRVAPDPMGIDNAARVATRPMGTDVADGAVYFFIGDGEVGDDAASGVVDAASCVGTQTDVNGPYFVGGELPSNVAAVVVGDRAAGVGDNAAISNVSAKTGIAVLQWTD